MNRGQVFYLITLFGLILIVLCAIVVPAMVFSLFLGMSWLFIVSVILTLIGAYHLQKIGSILYKHFTRS